MFQNMKVDIIYYKTNTDFEMEFNLCGCCRMRLLTDKTPDRKTMVHSLARAVSRSQIILIVSSLFGDSGSIASIAEAIGSKLVVADNKTYGIKVDDEISILDSSTPLVTPDGIFGGCIIERGPQTMILLSESKTIRKSIMQNLIHPYIAELYANILKEEVNPSNDNSQENLYSEEAETSGIICETEDTEEDGMEDMFLATDTETDKEPLENPTDDLITDSDEETEEIDEQENSSFVTEITEDDLPEIESSESEEIITEITESETLEEDVEALDDEIFFSDVEDEDDSKPIIPEELPVITDDDSYEFDNPTEDIEPYEQDEELVADAETENVPFKKYSLNLPILILTVVLLLTIAVLCYCIFFIPSSSGETGAEFVKETFDILFS